MATSSHVHYEEIDLVLDTRAASCPHVVVESRGGGSSAPAVDVPDFEERVRPE